MSAGARPPLTPAGCDLRDFPSMSIDINRLFASGFNATASTDPLAWVVGHKLWYRSWHQVPAASLPNDDAQLRHLAELGADHRAFAKVRSLAMRGWIECNDDRLYHPVVAEIALAAWLEKLSARAAGIRGNAKRWDHAADVAPYEEQIAAAESSLRALNPMSKALARLGRRRASQRNAGEGAR